MSLHPNLSDVARSLLLAITVGDPATTTPPDGVRATRRPQPPTPPLVSLAGEGSRKHVFQIQGHCHQPNLAHLGPMRLP